MSYNFGIIRLLFGLALLASVTFAVAAEKRSDKWLRVATGEESVIYVDKTSLVLESGQLIDASFRTSLSKDEPIPEIPDGKYLTRLDSIQFSLEDRRYRILKSTLLDSTGKVILSSQSRDGGDWKAAYGGTRYRLYNAAIQLAPFGSWTVKSYHYVSGEAPKGDDPPELTSLVGTQLYLSLSNNVQISNKTCHFPVFEPLTITSDEFLQKFGTRLQSFGIETSRVDALMLTCETVKTVVFLDAEDSRPTLKIKGAQPPVEYTIRKRVNPEEFPLQTLIIRLADGKAMMLWDGVFLEIERPGDPFLP